MLSMLAQFFGHGVGGGGGEGITYSRSWDISLETGLARMHSTGEGGALTLQTAVMREVKRIGKPELKPIKFPE